MAGSIQGDINQALGTLGALATFSPQLQEHAEKMSEKRKLKSEEKALNAQIESATSTGKALRPEVEEDIENRSRNIARRKFELNPSEETYSEYAKQLPMRFKEDPEAIHEERLESIPYEARRAAEYDHAYREAYNQELSRLDKMSQAMSRVGRQSEAKKTQRRNFMTYLAQQPTSLGGTVGDLPSDLQKQIASQYSRNERRNMMNRMDREAKDGKQK